MQGLVNRVGLHPQAQAESVQHPLPVALVDREHDNRAGEILAHPAQHLGVAQLDPLARHLAGNPVAVVPGQLQRRKRSSLACKSCSACLRLSGGSRPSMTRVVLILP